MRWLESCSVAIAFALVACGQPAAEPKEAGADSGGSAHAEPAVASGAADPAAILEALKLEPDAQGQIVNECGDRVTPSIVAAELGGAVGTAQLVAIGGGPSMAACYGDGPDLHLMKPEGAGYREIYAARGRMLIVLPTSHDGVHDLADGGPGFSFPVWQWNGGTYAPAGREVADADLSAATFLP